MQADFLPFTKDIPQKTIFVCSTEIVLKIKCSASCIGLNF